MHQLRCRALAACLLTAHRLSLPPPPPCLGPCRSPALLAGLGWAAGLPGAVLGSQLAALGDAHVRVTSDGLAQTLARVAPALYGALAGLPQPELAAAAAVLEGRRCVWVGNGFVPAERVAFKVRSWVQ